MTNSQAQAYAIIALNRLIDTGIVHAKNKKEALRRLDAHMYYAFDGLSENEAEGEAVKIMQDCVERIE
jgi:predicted transcriptional regulator